jgi:hypothetical protein
MTDRPPDPALSSRQEITTPDLVRVLYGKHAQYAYPDESHPLARWLDSEWQQFGTHQIKPKLVFVEAGELNLHYVGTVHPTIELHPTIFIESGIFKALTVHEQKAALSHEIYHALCGVPVTSRIEEYLADAAAAIRTSKECVIAVIKKTPSGENWLTRTFLNLLNHSHPSDTSRINAVANETYFTKAARFYESRMSVALPARVSRAPPISNPKAESVSPTETPQRGHKPPAYRLTLIKRDP